MRRFIKKFSLTVLLLASILSMLLSLSSCAFLLPKVTDKLPNEEIVKIEMVTEISFDNLERQKLSQEKAALFKDGLEELRYKKWVNWMGVKCRPLDFVWFVITYESYTVELGEHHILIIKGEERNRTTLSGVYPQHTFDEMFALFED